MFNSLRRICKENINLIVHKTNLENTVKLLAGILITIVIFGFLIGCYKAILDLPIIVHASVQNGLEQLLIDALSLLAVIEIIRTIMSYLADGRVKVTYVVDTVLIIMLNEVTTFWFTGNHTDFLTLISILTTLIFIRVLSIKFSPDPH